MIKLNYIDFKRLDEYIDLYFPENLDIIKRFSIKADFIGSVLRDGAGMNDYFEYEFNKKRHNERQKFVVRTKRKLIAKHFNNPNEVINFSDKGKFNQLFQEFVKREWIDFDTVSIELLKDFLSRHKDFLIKPKTESCGIGIKVIHSTGADDAEKLLKQYKGKKVLAEEILVQEGSVHALHPESLNTLRIVTVRLSDSDVRVMNANIRIGIDERIQDNFHQEGIAASVDVTSGIVNSAGCDMHLNHHLIHPVTKEKIIGYSVPQWEEAVEMAKKAALVIPEVSYVGWDIATSCKGYGVVLVEGNPDSDTDVQQMCDQVGKWPQYQELLNM
jgi:hypothetical protein